MIVSTEEVAPIHTSFNYSEIIKEPISVIIIIIIILLYQGFKDYYHHRRIKFYLKSISTLHRSKEILDSCLQSRVDLRFFIIISFSLLQKKRNYLYIQKHIQSLPLYIYTDTIRINKKMNKYIYTQSSVSHTSVQKFLCLSYAVNV